MKIKQAVITAAGKNQQPLPLQRLVDRDGVTKSVLQINLEEAISAGAERIGIIVCPGDENLYRAATGDLSARVQYLPQPAPLGYGHALFCARGFVGDQPFLHLVGDHLCVSGVAKRCAQQLVELAEAESCAVSGVQATRETMLPYYGTVGGRREAHRRQLYVIEEVLEKPTPTVAEQRLIVPGLRAGHYLCFFGLHVLTPAVMEILADQVQHAAADDPIQLSPALAALARRERYLALEIDGARYNVGVKYGLLTAQLAIAFSGADRDEVMTELLELLARQKQPGRHP
ncbi:UTP--glucose-1-phosphate uridylyltransferase [bacterium]|nr:UTP--glucose-1-phosphate uridylyltransferase [bacterium]